MGWFVPHGLRMNKPLLPWPCYLSWSDNLDRHQLPASGRLQVPFDHNWLGIQLL